MNIPAEKMTRFKMAQEKEAQKKPSYEEILKTAAPAKLIKTPKPKINEVQVHKTCFHWIV